MPSYKVEVLAPTGFTTNTAIQKEVQAKIDAYAKAGWRFHSMENVAGIGAVLGGAIGPYLVLVFESRT